MSQSTVAPDVGTAFPALVRVVPAGLARRSLARLLDLAIGAAALGALILVAVLGPDVSDARSVALVTLAVQVTAAALVIGVLLVFARTGLLPGAAILGLRQVRSATGGPPGLAGVVKYLVLAAITVPTLTLGYLATIATIARDPWQRSWVDRWLGLLVIDVKAGRDPWDESAGGPLLSAAEVSPPAPPAQGEPAGRPAPEPVPAPLGAPTTAAPAAAAPASAAPVGEATAPAEPGLPPGDQTTRTNPQVGVPVKPVQVRMPDGTRVLVSGPTAFGRNPAQPPGRPPCTLVSVEDPQRSVSKTHAVLTPQPGGVLVEDLNSTNGTAILTERGHVLVPAGVRLAARTGWRVALADVVLVVEDA